MAESIKVLGQLNPAANTLTDLYAVPALTAAVASTITIANQSALVGLRARVAVAVAAAADDPKQYVAYDVLVPALGVVTLTIGMTLATTDVVRVRSTTANASFNLFGTEIT